MKILQGSEVPVPFHEAVSAPARVSLDSQDQERLDNLEKIAATLLQRIQNIERKMDVQEVVPKAPPTTQPGSPASGSGKSLSPTTLSAEVSVDSEALRKGLLTKMWKYLNDR